MWDEVARNLQDPRRKRPHTRADVEHLMAAVRGAFHDAFVDGYQPLIPVMPVHEKDRHIAAMAVHAGAHVLVTYNTRHFPAGDLAAYNIEVQKPDDFLYNLYVQAPSATVGIIRAQASLLKNPPKTADDILDALEQVYVRRFARAIRAHLHA